MYFNLFYDSTDMWRYREEITKQVPDFNPYITKRRCDILQYLLMVLSSVVWILSNQRILFMWIPLLISVLITSFIEIFVIAIVPRTLYKIREKKAEKKREQMELLERLENIQRVTAKQVFGIDFCREILNAYEKQDFGTYDKLFKEIILRMQLMLEELSKVDFDINKYESLFSTILPDIHRLIMNDDDISEKLIEDMLISMKEYINQEIESIKMFPKIETSSSVVAYTNLFKSKTSGKEFKDGQ